MGRGLKINFFLRGIRTGGREELCHRGTRTGVAGREELVSQWIRTGVAGRKERLSQRVHDRGSGQGRTFIPERQLGVSLETV